MLIVIEGFDRVGKSTLIKNINSKTGYQYPTLDRGPVGFIIYDDIFKRSTNSRKKGLEQTAIELSKSNTLFVYLYANCEDIKNRLIEEGDKTFSFGCIDLYVESYKRLFSELYPQNKSLFINTSNHTPEQVYELVVNKVRQHETKTLPLLKKNCEDNLTEFDSFSKTYPEWLLRDLPKFDINVDNEYYTMLFHHLDHIIHKRNLNLINDRNMVYTSNDCISFIQIVPDVKTGQLNIFVTQRSFDYNKHRSNDLTFFLHWWDKSHIAETYSHLELRVHYTITCPHSYL